MGNPIGNRPVRRRGAFFCPRCGADCPPLAEQCPACDQDLRLVLDAVRRRAPDQPKRQRLRLLAATGGLVLGVLGGTLWLQREQEERAEHVALQHYLNGMWAAEVERWDLAVEEFGAAGFYRDAPQRREAAEAQLEQADERYESALGALREQRPWDAAYLLQQVVSVLPDYREAAAYLEEARGRVAPIVLLRQAPDRPREESTMVVLSTAERGQERVLASGLASAGSVAFATSGDWLTYETVEEGLFSLWLVSVASGEIVALVTEASDVWSRWSPDGRQLLYGWRGDTGWSIFLYTVAGGDSRRVARAADAATAEFSPGGAWYTVWSRDDNHWTLEIGETSGETAHRTLIERADSLGLLNWAENDSRLAFGYFLDGKWRLVWSAPAEGEPRGSASESAFSWVHFRPDGSAFVLWQWNARGGTLSLLSGAELKGEILSSSIADAWAAWSPDGQWLAIGEWNGRSWQVRLMHVDAAGRIDASKVLGTGMEDAEVSFAPGGQFLLLRSWREGEWTLTIHDLLNGEERIVLAGVPSAEASWSPEGTHLLLWWLEVPTTVSEAASLSGHLGVATAASGERVTLSERVDAVQGSYSRDGSKFAFAAQYHGEPASVWVANPDGTGLLELDHNSYGVYWARAPFQFGGRLPEPVR